MSDEDNDDDFKVDEDNIWVRNAEGRLKRNPVPSKAKTETGEAYPWFTRIVVMIGAVLFLGFNIDGAEFSETKFQRWGAFEVDQIWAGKWWALITCTFLHTEFFHGAFNLYWIWILGSRLERRLGTVKYALFYLAAGFVGSAAQIAFTDQTGIGASGAVYGIFGFLWIAAKRNPDYEDTIDQRTVTLFIFWFFLCFVLDYMEVLPIANAAHTAGCGFGVVAAYAVACKNRPAIAGLVAFFALSFLPLVWAPWSLGWLGYKALALHKSERFEEALSYYDRLLSRDPGAEWAQHNRGLVLYALGQSESGSQDE